MSLRRLAAASAALSAFALAGHAHALNVTTTNNATTLLNAMLGSGGAISVTSVSYSGAAIASGTYTDGPLGIGDGAIITSGSAQNSLPPSDSGNTSQNNNLGGHPLCNALIPGYTSYDASLLTIHFDLAGGSDGIQFNSVFGSEEYPEYVGSNFNDVYGVYLNGEQVAFDDNGNPITINGPFFSGGSVVLAPANGTEYDGTTGILTTRAELLGGSSNNTLQIVICDGGDGIYDSGAFLSGLNGCVGNDCSGTIPCAAIDSDGDGVNACDDCDDGNPETYPGGGEVCDGLDNDCDGGADEDSVCCIEIDVDGDGVSLCDDCDDNDPNNYPGGSESCDQADNNCNGEIDEGEGTCCAEIDDDGDGISLCFDCDDSDPGVFPGAPEHCDEADNDCNGLIDEGDTCVPECVTVQRGTFGSVEDAPIQENTPNYNLGSYANLYTGWKVDAGAKMSLVKFDLSFIPSTATVTEATLGLFQTYSGAASEVRVHQATAAWTENTVTWNSFGSSYDAAVIGSFTSFVNAFGWKTVDVTSTVDGWVGAANNGFLLEEDVGPGAVQHAYRSSETATVTDRPYLHVCFVD